MKSIGLSCRRVVLVGVTVALGLGGWTTALGAEDSLGFFEARRVAKEADQALKAERFDEAMEFYDRLIAGTPVKSGRHVEALYGSALAAVSKDPADLGLARERIEALSDSAAGDRRAEVVALDRLLARSEKMREEAVRAVAAEPVATEKKPESVAEKDSEAKSLKIQVRRLQKELEETRAELARKEEALEQLKEVVVGGNG